MRNNLKFIVIALLLILILGVSISRTKINFSLKSLLASLEISDKIEIIGNDGFNNSLTLDIKENPSVSYIDETRGLIFTKRDNAGWKEEVVSVDALAGNQTSLAFDSNGAPYILYTDKNFSLKMAGKKDDKWEIEKIYDDTAISSNLVIDKTNTPHIAFWETSKVALIYGKKAQGKWEIETVENGKVGWWNSLALDQDNYPRISYFDFGNKDLLYVFFDGKSWKKETVDFEGDVGRYSKLVLDSEGNSYITYFDEKNGNLKYAKRVNGGWELEKVNSEGISDGKSSIVLDANRNPFILFFDLTDKNFKLIKKIENSWQTTNTSIKGEADGDRFLALGMDGKLHLLVQDLVEKKLKYSNIIL